MKKAVIVVVVLAVLVGGGVLLWSMMGDDANAPSNNVPTPDTSTPTPTTDEDADEEENAAVITFTKDGFSPSTLTVKKGTIVTVKNSSSTDVQFSSADHPTHLENSELNLQVLKPGQSATIKLSRVGSFGYHDHLDDSKTGKIVVTE